MWAGLTRRKARLTLTVVSVAAAFLLFGLLASVNAAFKSFGQNAAAAHRLVTLARDSYTFGLPVGLYGKIQTVPGVRAASYVTGFFGTYQTVKHPVGGEAIGPDYFRVFAQYTIAPAALRAFRKTQTAVLAGRLLARRYRWKVGQQIPIRSPGLPRRNGSDVWTFLIAGIYTSKPRLMENAMLMHWSYLDLGRAARRGRVDAFLERIAHTRQAGLVAHRCAVGEFQSSDHNAALERPRGAHGPAGGRSRAHRVRRHGRGVLHSGAADRQRHRVCGA